MKTPFAPLAIAATLALTPVAAMAAPLNVVASFTILADFAQVIGGERVDVTTLVGRESDIHVYEPKPADAVAMKQADVILTNGLALEGFLDRLIDASETSAVIVEASSGIATLANPEHDDEDADEDHDHEDGDGHDHADEDHQDEHGHHDHGEFDPHAWLSARNALTYVDNIEAAFCAADIEGCGVYAENATHYRAELEKLDSDIRAIFAEIPEDRRTIITSHDAFGYFGQEYGLTFLAPQGISTESEASAADVADLVRQIRANHATALFTENITDPRIVNQISNETGIAIGGQLYTGALSLSEGPAATYIELMRYDAETIASAMKAE